MPRQPEGLRCYLLQTVSSPSLSSLATPPFPSHPQQIQPRLQKLNLMPFGCMPPKFKWLTVPIMRVRPPREEEDREATSDHGERQQPHLRLVPNHGVIHIPENPIIEIERETNLKVNTKSNNTSWHASSSTKKYQHEIPE